MNAWATYGSFEEDGKEASATSTTANTGATTTNTPNRPQSFIELLQSQHKGTPFPTDEYHHMTTLSQQLQSDIEEILGHAVGDPETYAIRKKDLKFMQANVPAVIIDSDTWKRVTHLTKSDAADSTIAFHVIVYPVKLDSLSYVNGFTMTRSSIVPKPGRPYHKYLAQMFYQLSLVPINAAEQTKEQTGHVFDSTIEVNGSSDEEDSDEMDDGEKRNALLSKKPKLQIFCYGKEVQLVQNFVVLFDGNLTFDLKTTHDTRDLLINRKSAAEAGSEEERAEDDALYVGRMTHLSKQTPRGSKKMKRAKPGKFTSASDIEMDDDSPANATQNPAIGYRSTSNYLAAYNATANTPQASRPASSATQATNSHDSQTLSFLDQLSKTSY